MYVCQKFRLKVLEKKKGTKNNSDKGIAKRILFVNK
tara:strand:- start:543 stop:650 length:108 start_codon:yes stop_codon:yes gene_type:complete